MDCAVRKLTHSFHPVRQCLHVGNPTAKIGYFPSGTRRLESENSLRKPDGKKLTFPVGKPTASVYLLTYLPYPNPCFALGSRLGRQWSSLRGYRPLITPPLAIEKLLIFITLCWTLFSVSFWTAYIISTFRVRVRVSFRARVWVRVRGRYR